MDKTTKRLRKREFESLGEQGKIAVSMPLVYMLLEKGKSSLSNNSIDEGTIDKKIEKMMPDDCSAFVRSPITYMGHHEGWEASCAVNYVKYVVAKALVKTQ